MAYTTIDKSDDYFNTKLYAGTDSAQSETGVGFQPDFTWIKCRSHGGSVSFEHVLTDAVRGANKTLTSDSNEAEAINNATGYLSSFDSDGFSLAAGATSIDAVAGAARNYVAWNWLASNTTASNTDGDINSTVSANTTSGFSIVSWTGTGTNPSTIGHGLGTAPSCIILKNRDASGGAGEWYVGHDGIGWTDRLKLNTTQATAASSTLWNNTAPTSSVFTISSALNFNGDATIAYCFAEKKGFSKFGSYTGNGSTDGTFIYTGFKPAFFITKRTDSTSSWQMYDNKRLGYNVDNDQMRADTNDAEDTSDDLDILSSGFKMRNTGAAYNASGGSYIYMAFAENPFVTSTGIPGLAR